MTDIVGTNGVIHVINDVLVPESARTPVDAIKSRKMDTMIELFDFAKLTDELTDMSNMTIFLPTEKALTELPESFIEELKADSQKLKEFLMYHVTTPTEQACCLETGSKYPLHSV